MADTKETGEALRGAIQSVEELLKGRDEKIAHLTEGLNRMPLLEAEVTRLAANLSSKMADHRRSEILHNAQLNRNDYPSVRGGKYDGLDIFDVQISHILGRHMESHPEAGQAQLPREMLTRWKDNTETAYQQLSEEMTRAMDVSVMGAGAELAYAAMSAAMWRDVHLATYVASLIPMVQMPTDPFMFPFDFGDVRWYRGRANVAPQSTNAVTGRRTLTTQELVGSVAFSYTLEEDAVVAVLPELRALLVRNAAELSDDVILNGDTSDDSTNINASGVGTGELVGGPLDYTLGFDGLLHIALVDHDDQSTSLTGDPEYSDYNWVRTRMGKYGVRPSDMAYIVDARTFIRSLVMDEVKSVDNFGPLATILTGQLASVAGVPLIVSEQLLLGGTDGKVSNTPSLNIFGRILGVARRMYMVGYRRMLELEAERDMQRRQTIMVASIRMAFDGRNDNGSDQAVALAYHLS